MEQKTAQQDRYAKDCIYAIDFEPSTSTAALPARSIHARYHQLTRSNMMEWGPSVVFLPLIGASEDAATIVELLESIAFQGDIVVICPQLPKPQLVERELRGLGPGQRLRLVQED
jgi:hypothetical protein